MSHHFDTALAKVDPRLNVADMYLFAGQAGSTAMIITTNADTDISAPDTLHEEGIYSFRFHRTASDEEDLVFKFRFSAPRHTDGDECTQVQPYRVFRAEKGNIPGNGGDLLLEGESGRFCEQGGVRAFVGTVPELWAADAAAFAAFLKSLHEEGRFNPSVFERKENFFRFRNVTALVLEVPNSLIGSGTVRVWSSISLFGHAPEVQVSRWGVPLFTHLFLSEPGSDLVEQYHRSLPRQDRELYAPSIARFVSRVARLAGTAKQPEDYGRAVAQRICPSLLPYDLGTEASFTVNVFNGRPLADDALDVMFSLAANVPFSDGVSPDRDRLINSFPYYGLPYSKEEQQGLEPIPQHAANAREVSVCG